MDETGHVPLPHCRLDVWVNVAGAMMGDASVESDADGLVDFTEAYPAWQPAIEQHPKSARLIFRSIHGPLVAAIEPALLEQQPPARLPVKLGPVRVHCSLVDRHGRALANWIDAFPAPLKPFLTGNDNSFWVLSLRDVATAGDHPQPLFNSIVAEHGTFDVFLEPGHAYHLDGPSEVIIDNPVIAVDATTRNIRFRIRRRHTYCLYGSLLDADSGKPINGLVELHALTADNSVYESFHNLRPWYAMFFDAPAELQIIATSMPPNRPHGSQTFAVHLTQHFQRHDVHLMSVAPTTLIPVHVKVRGSIPRDAQLWFNGPHQTVGGRYHEDKGLFEFSLPEPGRYRLAGSAESMAFQPIDVTIDHEQTIEFAGIPKTPKDTVLIIALRDPKGQPVNVPLRSVRSGVCYEVELFAREPILVRPLQCETPYANGEVTFRMVEGGSFMVRVHLDGYEEASMPVELATHETKRIELRLIPVP